MHLCFWGTHTAPAPIVSAEPKAGEQKVRVALTALDQASQASASRSVGMDTKASILLVIAGIITTSPLDGDGLLHRASIVIALMAGVAALVSLWPRKIPGVHPKTVTDQLTSNSDTLPQFEYWLLAMHKAAAVIREQHMEIRGRYLAAGFTLAVISMALTAVSLIQDGDWLATWLGAFLQTGGPPTVSPTPN